MDIDGKTIAKHIQRELKETISHKSISPGLAFFLIGDHLPSKTYVGMKERACQEVGIRSEKIELPEDIAEKTLLQKIKEYNQRDDIDGILVQMPLPRHINETAVISTIDPNKDVDGFHPLNIGKMLVGDPDAFLPCTPFGILKLLEHEKIDPAGKEVVVVGRSNIVGKPIANLLMQRKYPGNATVTVAHSKTSNLPEVCRRADILIAAVGIAKFITADMVKEGAVVIDVGINRVEEGLVGDVDYKHVAPKCAKITPVPGGVGPMTIAMLLYNTLHSHLRRQ